MKRILEVACFDVTSALTAADAGADRIEFCSDYLSGGITPSIEDIIFLKQKIKVPVFVLIRCRPGNFVYDEAETLVMSISIEQCRTAKVDGIVVGALDNYGLPDINKCEKWKAVAGNMGLTFHRAFDVSTDRLAAVKRLISLGFDRILSSGGAENVLDGMSELAALQGKFGEKISIMPGGGLRSNNLAALLSLGFKEFHSSCITGNDLKPDPAEIQKMKSFLLV